MNANRSLEATALGISFSCGTDLLMFQSSSMRDISAVPQILSDMAASRVTPFMKTKIDIKSAVVGLGFGVLIMLGIAAASSSGTVGRFQIAGTGNQGLVLDTVTGQVWTGYFSSSGGKTDGDFYQPKIGNKK